MKKSLLTLTFTFTFFHFLLAQNFNLQLRSEVHNKRSCASIWGYAQNGREYALVGDSVGVMIVDVTDPDNPDSLFDVSQQGGLSEWREIKTYEHYAYATNEHGSGLLIIDLQYLPDSVHKYTFIYNDGQGNQQTTGHTLWIDENARLYVFGGNYAQGYTCFDLTSNPLNPPFLGSYQSHYIHDGFARGDTLWAGEINDGRVEVLDVSDPANPISMAAWNTPNHFSHNCWPTHDDHYIFTTDEVNNSYLTSYDVSDLSNITELDRAQSNPGSGTIIHNVHLLNDQFATVAYYKDGVVLFDVSHPDNIIECGSYDTDPGESGGNYGGTWGVYPYLPSGNIIVSDLSDAGESGGKLSVLTPTYVAACWLSGTITDSVTGVLLNNVYVEVETTQNTDYSDLSGVYKTGNGIPGTYTVRYTKTGYVTKEISGITLTSGIETTLDVQLVPLTSFAISGQVVDSITNAPIQGASVFFTSSEGYQFTATTDANGNFTFNGFQSTYDIYVGRWGYHETGESQIAVNPNPLPFLFKLKKGYYDDFELNLGWATSQTASTGWWTRCEPIGTNYYYYFLVNPEIDLDGDWGDQCFVTGNGGGGIGTDDVDNGTVTLTSPTMDLANYGDAVIKFYGWFANLGGNGNPNDTLNVYLTNGNTSAHVLQINANNFTQSQWNYHELHVSDYIVPTANMKVTFTVGDLPSSGHVTEGAVDYFRVDDENPTSVSVVTDDGGKLHAYPNPFNNEEIINYHFDQLSSDAHMDVFDVLGNKLQSLTITTSSGEFSFGKNLSQGVYFVHLVENDKTLGVMKVVKQH